MVDILSLGTSSVLVNQRALATIANNVANAATDGYSRQRVDITQNAPNNTNGLWFGTGARLTSVTRLFDGLVENNLRNSITMTAAQQPLIDEISNVVNQLGSSATGLSSAMDMFFSSLREWTTDASSFSLRNQVISEGRQLAERFERMDQVMKVAEMDSRRRIENEIDTINGYAEELARVNRQLGRQISLEKQPPQLLDERDLLLRKLSEHVKVDIREAANGAVNVFMGVSASSIPIVGDREAFRIGAEMDPRNPESVRLLIDPLNRREQLGGVSGGALGGLLAFRSSALAPTANALDQLARVFVQSVNDLHRQGIDWNGNLAGDMFRIDPQYVLRGGQGESGGFAASSTVVNAEELTGNAITLRYDPAVGRWQGIDNGTGERALARDNGQIELSGLSILVRGASNSLVDLNYESTRSAAGGFAFALSAPEQLASSAPLRVRADISNTSTAIPELAIQFATDLSSGTVPALDQAFLNNPFADSSLSRTIRPSFFEPVAQIPGGFSQVSLDLSNAGADTQLQIFTREGRHLSGSELSPEERNALITANGFAPGASYSAAYLNAERAGGLQNIRVPVADLDLRSGLVINGQTITLSVGTNQFTSAEDLVSRINAESPNTQVVATLSSNREVTLKHVDGQDITIENNGSETSNALGVEEGDYSGTVPYLGMDGLSVGARALPGTKQNAEGFPITSPATLDATRRVNLQSELAADRLTLNGVSLPKLDANTSAFATARTLNEYEVNGKNLAAAAGVVVSASNEIRVDFDRIKLDLGLRINNVTIGDQFSTRTQLVDEINRNSGDTGVVAFISPDREVVLRRSTGGDITIGNNGAGNALGLISGTTFTGTLQFQGLEDVRVPSSELAAALTGPSFLMINSVQIKPPSNGFANLTDLVTAINEPVDVNGDRLLDADGNPVPGVDVHSAIASISGSGPNQVLVLRNTNPDSPLDVGYLREFEFIDSNGVRKVNPNPNLYDPTDQSERHRPIIERIDPDALTREFQEVNLLLGPQGTPADLARLGFSTSVFIDEAFGEDLLVFVTGDAADRPRLAAGYVSGEASPLERVREKDLRVEFFSDITGSVVPDSYRVIDQATGTILAEHGGWSFSDDPVVRFGPFTMTFSVPPTRGDVFRVDDNGSGVADNRIIRSLVEMESQEQEGLRGRTVGQAYSIIVGSLGDQLRQANLSADALAVVREQAEQARDQISGVSLDEEAADLIRFQQAYQASARIIQTSQQLFESILRL